MPASANGLIGSLGGMGELDREVWKRKTSSAAKNLRPVSDGSRAGPVGPVSATERTGDMVMR